MDVDVLVAYVDEHGCFPEDHEGRGTILGWSRQSRARMIARLSDLDYTALYGVHRVCLGKGCRKAYARAGPLSALPLRQVHADRPVEPATGDADAH